MMRQNLLQKIAVAMVSLFVFTTGFAGTDVSCDSQFPTPNSKGFCQCYGKVAIKACEYAKILPDCNNSSRLISQAEVVLKAENNNVPLFCKQYAFMSPPADRPNCVVDMTRLSGQVVNYCGVTF